MWFETFQNDFRLFPYSGKIYRGLKIISRHSEIILRNSESIRTILEWIELLKNDLKIFFGQSGINSRHSGTSESFKNILK